MKKTATGDEKEEARKTRKEIFTERWLYKGSITALISDVESQLEEIIRAKFSKKPAGNFALYHELNGERITIAELLYFLGAIKVLLSAVHYEVALRSPY